MAGYGSHDDGRMLPGGLGAISLQMKQKMKERVQEEVYENKEQKENKGKPGKA